MLTGAERAGPQTRVPDSRSEEFRMPTCNVLVTGANRGIGLEFVRQLLARQTGGKVIACCRHPGKATALNTLAGEHPGHLHVMPLDVADPKSHLALAHELPLVLGDRGQLDLLVNNAGVLHSGERFGTVSAGNLEDSLRTNAVGPFLLTQTLAPLLAEGARVANLSSALGSISGVARFGTPSYRISKAAQNMANILLAKALAERSIFVVTLHPGWVQTAMGGEQAPVTVPDSVAGMLQVIDGLQEEDSGSFRDYLGQPIEW